MPARDVIKVAQGELLYTENPPGSNRVKYWDEFGAGWQGQPWCVAFLWWCFQHAGEKMAFFAGAKTASCGTLLRWYQAQGLTVPVDEVRPGDIVILNFHHTSAPEHCGIVESVNHGTILYVTTIEGNTSVGDGSQDNGGCVARKTRYRSQIVGVCRPEYKEEEMPKTDYEKHWAKSDIEWAVALGYIKGYPDGSFHPDEPITRAETITVDRRIVDSIMAEIATLKAEIATLKAEIAALKAEIAALKGGINQ